MRGTILKKFGSKYSYKDPNPQTESESEKKLWIRIRKKWIRIRNTAGTVVAGSIVVIIRIRERKMFGFILDADPQHC
jgi:hypothetical protein